MKATYVELMLALSMVKAVGGSGSVADRIENDELSVPVPTTFIDAT